MHVYRDAYRLSQLIDQGSRLLLQPSIVDRIPGRRSVERWKYKAIQALRIYEESGKEETLSYEAESISTEDVLRRLTTCLDDILAKRNFDEHLHLLVDEKIMSSKWLKVGMAATVITVGFAVFGTLQIGSETLDFRESIENSKKSIDETQKAFETNAQNASQRLGEQVEIAEDFTKRLDNEIGGYNDQFAALASTANDTATRLTQLQTQMAELSREMSTIVTTAAAQATQEAQRSTLDTAEALSLRFSEVETKLATNTATITATANNLRNWRIPEGSVVSMAITSPTGLSDRCPVGWVRYEPANERTIIGSSNRAEYRAGHQGGNSTVSLTVEQMPRHQHETQIKIEAQVATHGSVPNSNNLMYDRNLNPGDAALSSAVGDNAPISILPPYVALPFCIKVG